MQKECKEESKTIRKNMNKTELKKFYQSELRDMEISKSVLEQNLISITNRERKIKSALEKLGASTQARKGKKQVLTPRQLLELRANLTK